MLRRALFRLVVLMAFMTTPLLMPPAQAAWSTFKQLSNTSLESDPSCAIESADVALCCSDRPR